ncbi:MAG: DoxX family protein [Oligoflexia bacterium]|nr:DoxX family protein [Oligoflexia bacterium]
MERELRTVRPYPSDGLALAGRILLGAIFIISGLSKIPSWGVALQMIASKQLPLPELLLGLATVVEIGAGVALLLGWRARGAAVLLFLYLVPVTLFFHNFWSYSGGERTLQLIMFLKNLSIMGGMLGVAANGPGLYSIDGRRARRLETDITVERPRLRRVS